ncbi:MAG: trypsin-like serine protease [bacterium]|nr:trypsin-like serine protease [bacterium]
MAAKQHSIVRQFILMTASTIVALLIVVKADILGRIAYSVERGRLQAMRESLPSTEELEDSFTPERAVVATVVPGVVSISTERMLTQADFDGMPPELHRRFFSDVPQPDARTDGVVPTEGSTNGAEADTNGAEADTNGATPAGEGLLFSIPTGQGSGFIIDADHGYVITNHHVVAQGTAIHVRLADGRRLDAELLGADAKSDIAVLRIDAQRLHELPWGDSQSTRVGDPVFAVGNPFGLDGTVSRGIVSAMNRSEIVLHDIEYQGFLQTDAVINPGNSGGPLVNMRGEVVGINTAIATRSGNYDGIGFAIPAHRAAKLVPMLIRGEQVVRGYLGVQMAAAGRADGIRQELGWDHPGGVAVTAIVEDSPASRSDLRIDDVIVEYAGRPIASNADVIHAVGDTPPGTKVDLKVWREGGFVVVTVEIGAQPEGFTTRVRRR